MQEIWGKPLTQIKRWSIICLTRKVKLCCLWVIYHMLIITLYMTMGDGIYLAGLLRRVLPITPGLQKLAIMNLISFLRL